jgi:hypothetical protein
MQCSSQPRTLCPRHGASCHRLAHHKQPQVDAGPGNIRHLDASFRKRFQRHVSGGQISQKISHPPTPKLLLLIVHKRKIHTESESQGGNLINYPGELTTRTADMITTKLHWNSVLGTPKARNMCLNISNFYLTATLDRYEYIKMPINLSPPWIIKQYNLHNKVVGGYIYLQMRKTVWGLPQAGILANIPCPPRLL